MQFHIPQKPFNAIDAINRQFIATGSVRMAQAHHHGSEINGHHNVLAFNDYRKYWVGEFSWSGRNVFVRSSDFAEALAVAIREFDSQGKGATLIIEVESPEDIATCRANPRLVEGAESRPAWRTWHHDHAASFIAFEKQFGGMDAIAFAAADSYESWMKAVSAALKARRDQSAALQLAAD